MHVPGAIVLAAGSGCRIGTPKLRLQKDGKSYLESILEVLRFECIQPVVCVVAAAQEEWSRKLAGSATIIVNRYPENGMISSIQLGISALQATAGVFIVPVDHPYVTVATYHLLKQAFMQNPDAVVKPSYKKQSGHPIIIPAKLYDAVQVAAQGSSLRELLQQLDARQIFVEVSDEGILKNINEPGDIPE
jgi:molybdenum cofactor cytidylyltransferase